MKCRCLERENNFSSTPYHLRCLFILLGTLSILATVGFILYFLVLQGEIIKEPQLAEDVYDGSLSELDYNPKPVGEPWSPKCLSTNEMALHIVDCYPEGTANEKKCQLRGCCWNGSKENPVNCYYPGNYGYSLDGMVESNFDGFEVPLKRLSMPSRYGDDIQHIKLKVDPQTPYRLRATFYDPEESRYRVPEPIIKVSQDVVVETVPLYSVNYNTTVSPFGLKIRRTDTETVIFDTNLGGLTFSPQFLQISTRLPSKFLFGLGDSPNFKIDLNWTSWTLFSRFSESEFHETSYGFHPFYICLEDNGNAYGVLLLNSNAIELQAMPHQVLTYRAYGGILDFYFFLGPTPKDVLKQYFDAIGYPAFPPYWALGHHLSTYDVEHPSELYQAVETFKKNQIPLESVTIRLNHSRENPPFKHPRSSNEQLDKLVDILERNKQRLLIVVDPGISSEQPRDRYPPYDKGVNLGIFINNTYGIEPLHGLGIAGDVVFPDFGNPNIELWWLDRLAELHSDWKFHGLWLDRNSPVNMIDGSTSGCFQDNLNKPGYFSRRLKQIYKNTICMDSRQWWLTNEHIHYDMHNLYGYSMAKRTEAALRTLIPDKSTMLVSSSTFIGSGQYAGHKSPIKSQSWDSLKRLLYSVLQYGIAGIPFTGASNCDSLNDDELCLRSIQLGSFLPFFSTSSFYKMIVNLKSNATLVEAVLTAMRTRYEILPYLYTLFHEAHQKRGLVANPLWMQYPNDQLTHNIENQYLLGDGLMISPVLTQETSTLKIYFPEDIWYDYFTAEQISNSSHTQEFESYLYSTIRPIALHVRGGRILPQQFYNTTIYESRHNPMTLFVALDSEQKASGKLYWDDGVSQDSYQKGEYIEVSFEANAGSLRVSYIMGKPVFNSDFDNVYISQVKILGLRDQPNNVQIDGSYILPKLLIWDSTIKSLFIHQIRIPLTRETTIQWDL